MFSYKFRLLGFIPALPTFQGRSSGVWLIEPPVIKAWGGPVTWEPAPTIPQGLLHPLWLWPLRSYWSRRKCVQPGVWLRLTANTRDPQGLFKSLSLGFFIHKTGLMIVPPCARGPACKELSYSKVSTLQILQHDTNAGRAQVTTDGSPEQCPYAGSRLSPWLPPRVNTCSASGCPQVSLGESPSPRTRVSGPFWTPAPLHMLGQ